MTADERQVEATIALARRRARLRTFPVLASMAVVGVTVYFALPLLLTLTRPAAPPGGWVVDPPHFVRAFVGLYSPAVIVPFCILPFLRKRWARRDAADGFVIKPKKYLDWSNPALAVWRLILTVLVGLPLLALIPLSFAMYLTGFKLVSDAGITDNIRFQHILRGYDQVKAVARVPAGKYLARSRKPGPLVYVLFNNGRDFIAGAENGLSDAEVDRLATYIAAHAHQPIQTPPGLHGQ